MVKISKLLLLVTIALTATMVPYVKPLYASQCLGAAESGQWFNENFDSGQVQIGLGICDYAEAKGDLTNYFPCETPGDDCKLRMDHLVWHDYQDRVAVSWTDFDNVRIVQWLYFDDIVENGPGRWHGGELTVVYELRWKDGRETESWTEYFVRQ